MVVVIHANRRTFGKITQPAWLTERFGQAPDEWTLVMRLVNACKPACYNIKSVERATPSVTESQRVSLGAEYL